MIIYTNNILIITIIRIRITIIITIIIILILIIIILLIIILLLIIIILIIILIVIIIMILIFLHFSFGAKIYTKYALPTRQFNHQPPKQLAELFSFAWKTLESTIFLRQLWLVSGVSS